MQFWGAIFVVLLMASAWVIGAWTGVSLWLQRRKDLRKRATPGALGHRRDPPLSIMLVKVAFAGWFYSVTFSLAVRHFWIVVTSAGICYITVFCVVRLLKVHKILFGPQDDRSRHAFHLPWYVVLASALSLGIAVGLAVASRDWLAAGSLFFGSCGGFFMAINLPPLPEPETSRGES